MEFFIFLVSFSFALDQSGFARVPIIVKSGDIVVVLRGLIDTGADAIYIDSHIAEYMGLLPFGVEDVGAAGGTLRARRTILESVAIISSDFQMKLARDNVNAFIVQSLGEEIVIGTRFFENCNLSFNFVNMKLVIEGNWIKL